MTRETEISKPEISVIQVKGYLDVITSEELDNSISHLIDAGSCYIIVDLADVEYISSMGWGVFVSKIKEIREAGGDLKLARMRAHVFEVFRILEFEWFLSYYDTIDEAAADFDLPPRECTPAYL